jgi:hypothetical protein
MISRSSGNTKLEMQELVKLRKPKKKLSWHLLKTLMVCVVAMGNLVYNTEMANKETV